MPVAVDTETSAVTALLADNGNLDNGLDDYIDDSQNDDSSFF